MIYKAGLTRRDRPFGASRKSVLEDVMEIVLNEQGIRIGEEYHIVLASSLFYFRVPEERWEQRMQLLKVAGYNAIDVYFPWNYHEIAPGRWDFEKNRDVRRFLSLAKENDLFVIARPGPYICSEWDGGAIPAWLYTENIPVRQDDPRFLDAMHSWYARILPILRDYQITRGGTVICMQIENELDFYDCRSPVTYMGKLKAMAETFGMEIPLFYCCGQDNIVKAGGLTEGLYSSFNVYAEEDFPHLERRCLHLFEAASLRQLPFMITETNRRHDWIKRLLISGAKLLGPYNQTAGITMDNYNGITNWGPKDAPVALMTTDYDFHSMIGSAGNYNREIIRARLFAGFLYSFREALGCGKPVESDLEAIGEGINSLIPMLMTQQGNFAEISNLSSKEQIYQIKRAGRSVPFDLASLETRILPVDLQINERVKIGLCTYEIASVTKEEKYTIVWLYGHGKAYISVQSENDNQELELEEPENGFQISFENVIFRFGRDEYVSAKGLPFLPTLNVPPEKQEEEIPVLEQKVYDCVLSKTGSVDGMVQPMERFGLFRGCGAYDVTILSAGSYLFSGLADIVTFLQGDIAQTIYCNGSTRILDLKRGPLTILTEIWGHANFDDIRVKSLRMGSLKGVESILQILRKEDITSGWIGYELSQKPGETCFFQHSPYHAMMNADGLNRAVSPLITLMNRTIYSGQEENGLFLSFEKAECLIDVYVNNQKVASVVKDDPFVDLSEYAGRGSLELTILTERRYYTDEVGKVTLYAGKKVTDCVFSEILPEKGSRKEERLPITFEKDRNKMIELAPDLKSGEEAKLFFTGRNVKLTVYSGDHIMGRIYLSDTSIPVVTGGTPDTAMVLGEWLQNEPVRIWCQALDNDAVLYDVHAKRYLNGVSCQ